MTWTFISKATNYSQRLQERKKQTTLKNSTLYRQTTLKNNLPYSKVFRVKQLELKQNTNVIFSIHKYQQSKIDGNKMLKEKIREKKYIPLTLT